MTPGCTPVDSWERRFGISEWERQTVTICIAAICDNGHGLVLAADRELGIGITSAEFPDGKFFPLFFDWYAGISGLATNAADIIANARTVTRAPDKSMPSLSTDEARDVIEKAYRRARLRQAEARFLANHGWTLEEFKKEGSSKLPITTFAGMDAQIAQFDFGAELIVPGFGRDDDGPSILTVKNPGITVDHTKLGFWCVGSGSTAAQISLFNRTYSWSITPEMAAYYLYEAKISAEHATGVGRQETDIYLIRPKGQPIHLQPPAMSALRDVYDELKPKDFKEEHQLKLGGMNEFKAFAKL
jgi:20S proteasome alpha/beta subunit